MSQAARKDGGASAQPQAAGGLKLVEARGEEAFGSEKSLLGTIGQMSESLKTMMDIIQKASYIAVSAAIEAARTQTQSENFALVADQVRRQAEKTDELAQSLEREIAELEVYAMRATAVRFADIASDLIDKVDRNLFERNCDCQAWASFDETVACAEATMGLAGQSVVDAVASGAAWAEPLAAAIESASSCLGRMCETYRVYLDVFALNNMGVIVAAARNRSLIGRDESDQAYVLQVLEKGEVHVSDMHQSPSVGALTVSYSAPIKDKEGRVIGVLSTRFDWRIVQDMLERMPVDNATRLFLVNSEGLLIATKPGRGVLTDGLAWLMAGEAAIDGRSGYTVECARNGQLSAWGYCHTYGFAGYKGKGWSAIVSHPVRAKRRDFLSEIIERDGNANRQAADLANVDLERVTAQISTHVGRINAINNETNMLAVNAAIQAGVAGADGESFSVIASEIGKLAKQSENFVTTINGLTETLGRGVRETVFTRLGEAAFDTIDKIDRNLFERYCDVQAFATFPSLRNFLTDRSKPDTIQDLLLRLHDIYEVYHDIFLLDAQGVIVAAAKHRELTGTSQRDRDWFREAANGKVVVTDLYQSSSVNEYTVTFAAPVTADSGRLLGVLTTRFNCKFIYDIMKATIVGSGSDVHLVNSKGLVIGTTTGEGVLKDSLAHLKAFRALGSSGLGFVIEREPTGAGSFAVGYARGHGYLTFSGKGWGVLIRRDIQDDARRLDADVSNNK